MSKTASPSSSLSAPAAGLFRCALAACALAMPAAWAVADPGLRPAEQIDLRRLGKVSETERSVLRVEWRAATTGADEARAVQDMLDRLRRMEDTVGGIGRLLKAMPAQTAAATPTAPEPESDWKGLALAAGVAVLAIFFWLRRRSGEAPEAVRPGVEPAPAAMLPPGSDSDEPRAVAADASEPAPGLAAAHDVPPPMPAAENAGSDRPLPPAGPRIAAEAAATTPRPSAAEPPPSPPGAAPTVDAERPAAPKANIPPIEFTLEEADPESVARENERVQKLQAASHANAPAAQEESHVEPTLELAEIMLSMGLEQSAAQALVEFSEANPRQALYHWLKLLDIYRNSGHRKDFKETAEKLRQHFNIQAEDWTRSRDGEAPTLEDFPRIATHVQEVWSQPVECTTYLRHLLEDNREGSRAGFPQSVAEEILLLIEILGEPAGAFQAAGT